MNVAAVQQVVGIGRAILVKPCDYTVGEIVRIFLQVVERFLRHDALIHVINGHIGGHTGSFIERLNSHFLAVQRSNHICLFVHLYPEDLARLQVRQPADSILAGNISTISWQFLNRLFDAISFLFFLVQSRQIMLCLGGGKVNYFVH